jgi:hypothetical protein
LARAATSFTRGEPASSCGRTGIAIDADGALWCADDCDHTVRKFTPKGRLLLTLGTRGTPSDTGATSNDFRTIRRCGPPFHYPTNTAFSPRGEIARSHMLWPGLLTVP